MQQCLSGALCPRGLLTEKCFHDLSRNKRPNIPAGVNEERAVSNWDQCEKKQTRRTKEIWWHWWWKRSNRKEEDDGQKKNGEGAFKWTEPWRQTDSSPGKKVLLMWVNVSFLWKNSRGWRWIPSLLLLLTSSQFRSQLWTKPYIPPYPGTKTHSSSPLSCSSPSIGGHGVSEDWRGLKE